MIISRRTSTPVFTPEGNVEIVESDQLMVRICVKGNHRADDEITYADLPLPAFLLLVDRADSLRQLGLMLEEEAGLLQPKVLAAKA